MTGKEREVVVIPPKNGKDDNGGIKRQLRVASYSRVSTDAEEQLTSFYTQKTYYTDLIMKNPEWALVGTYADEGISGASANKRPEFMKMIKKCYRGKIDLIITKSISRFARNTLDSIGYVRKLKAKGIGVFFEKENINTLEESSEVVLTILSSLAQEELNSMSMNIKMGRRMAMQEGRFNYNFAKLFGYTVDEEGIPVIVLNEGKVVKRIFSSYLAGDSMGKIADNLMQDGIPAPSGKLSWKRERIRAILNNEKYCGDVLLQKTYVTDPISKQVKQNNGVLPKYLIKNNHQGIISRDTFEETQLELARRNNKKKVSKFTSTSRGKYSSLYALTSKLICGDCGTPYRRTVWTKRDGEKQPVWRCINRIENGKKYCENSPTLDEASLHMAIMEALMKCSSKAEILSMELVKELASAMNSREKVKLGESVNVDVENIETLENQIAQIVENIMLILEESMKSDCGMTKTEAESKIQTLSNEAKKLQQKVDELKVNNAVIKDIQSSKVKTKINHIEESLKNLGNMEIEYSDKLVRQCIENIKVINENQIIIYLNNGTKIQQSISNKVKPLKSKQA